MQELFSYLILSYIFIFFIGLIIGRILSYYIRKFILEEEGRCRICSNRLSPVYSVVEILNSLIYLLLLKTYGLSVEFIGYAFLSSVLLIITFIDLRLMLIPNKLVVLIFAVGLAFAFFASNISWLDRSIGFFAAGLILLLIAIVSKGGLGGGDIKLMAVCGFFIGWKLIIWSMILASIIGGMFGLFMLITGKGKLKTDIPFAPFLMTGIIASILFGEISIQWYIGLF